MIIIRLQKVGKKHTATFRVVLTEKTAGPGRKYLELLGNINRKMKTASLKKDRILYWLGKGAQTSASIHNLLVSQGIISAAKKPVHKTSKKPPVVATAETVPEAVMEPALETTPAA